MSFTFRRFHLDDSHTAMKVGTDSTVLGAWARLPDSGGAPRILDLGAGCGILALMLAQRAPGATVTAVEADPGAAADLRRNIALSPFAARVAPLEADALDPGALPHGHYDMVVCNPPYFTETLRAPDAARAAARHEGPLGVASMTALAARVLRPGGSLAFVVPAARAAEALGLLAIHRFGLPRRMAMRQRPGRPEVRNFIQAWLGADAPPPATEPTLTVNTPGGSRTEAYAALTADFYLQ